MQAALSRLEKNYLNAMKKKNNLLEIVGKITFIANKFYYYFGLYIF